MTGPRHTEVLEGSGGLGDIDTMLSFVCVNVATEPSMCLRWLMNYWETKWKMFCFCNRSLARMSHTLNNWSLVTSCLRWRWCGGKRWCDVFGYIGSKWYLSCMMVKRYHGRSNVFLHSTQHLSTSTFSFTSLSVIIHFFTNTNSI